MALWLCSLPAHHETYSTGLRDLANGVPGRVLDTTKTQDTRKGHEGGPAKRRKPSGCRENGKARLDASEGAPRSGGMLRPKRTRGQGRRLDSDTSSAD